MHPSRGSGALTFRDVTFRDWVTIVVRRLDSPAEERIRKPDVELRTNHNDRSESQIVFAWDDASKYSSTLEFYAQAVRKFWNDSESSIGVETYIGNAEEVDRDFAFMRQEINASLEITPIDGIQLNFENMTDCRTFRHDWNVKELVWQSDTKFWYMLWETAA